MITAIFFIAMVIYLASVNKKGAEKKVLIIFFLTFFTVPLVALIEDKITSNFTNEDNTIVADGFTIEGYEVILDVGIDNKVNVTENIDINFYESYHHGIYKFTPYWLEYTGKDNKTIKRKSKIKNLRAIGDQYTVDTVNGKSRIKIGSPNSYVIDDHRYTINYIYDMGKDPFNNFDEFIFHAFGDFWGTEIKNPKIIVHMPKDINQYDINFYKDKYRKEKINNLINYNVDGRTITITGNNLQLYKSLTVDVSLPEGYFEGGSWNYGFISLMISLVIIGATIYIIIMWKRYGKNHEEKVPTVEFYAPDDLSSAEIGYVYNKRTASKKLTISLILQLASKGYIKINEIKDGKNKNSVQIIRNFVKPKKTDIKDITVPKRSIEIEKIKDVDDNLSNDAKNMMVYMFKDSNRKTLQANINKFLEVKDALVNGGYINIIEDIDLQSDSEKKEKYINEFKEKYENDYNEALKIYENEIGKLPKKSNLENIVYGLLFCNSDNIILSEHTSFYQAFGQIEDALDESFKKKVYDDVSRKQKNKTFIITIASLILSALSFFYIEDMDPRLSILYYIPFGCVFIDLIFSFIMGRKTEYGEYIYARVKGFREFLLTAEKEKLESLVEQNPHYFYDILPYTYVLNVSKKWIKKFENIKMPDVDMGNFNYSSDASFHSIFDNVYYPPSSPGGGSSGCGGGCSSCGGGCSSCGGGGSW